MKRLLVALGLVAAGLAFTPSPGRCVWCPIPTCWEADQCGAGCSCLKQGTDIDGICVEITTAPLYLRDGWSELPARKGRK